MPVQAILASLLNAANDDGTNAAGDVEEEYTYIRQVFVRRPAPTPWLALLFHRQAREHYLGFSLTSQPLYLFQVTNSVQAFLSTQGFSQNHTSRESSNVTPAKVSSERKSNKVHVSLRGGARTSHDVIVSERASLLAQ